MLVMHISEGAAAKTVCGALFYPDCDEGILALQSLVKELDGR
jgi:hypothetical protein